MKRLGTTVLLIATVITMISFLTALPALATGPANPPPGQMGIMGWLQPGTMTTITNLAPGKTAEYMVNNPGRLIVSSLHDDYNDNSLGPTFFVWAPDRIDRLHQREQSQIDEDVPWTGAGSVCNAGDRGLPFSTGCTTKWDGGGKFAEGFWLMRVYNPTPAPLTITIRVEGEYKCLVNCD